MVNILSLDLSQSKFAYNIPLAFGSGNIYKLTLISVSGSIFALDYGMHGML